MRKSQADYNKAYIERMRRKAQAFDRLLVQLSAVLEPEDDKQAAVIWEQSRPMVQMFVRGAARAAQE